MATKEINKEEIIVENNKTIENNFNNNSTYEEVIKKLLLNGGKRINNLIIKNVNITEKTNHNMVSLTLKSSIPAFVTNDNGLTYKEGFNNIIFTSTYAIAGGFKEDEELSWMANDIINNPKILNILLNGSMIDIIQTHIPAGTEFQNPFSTKDSSNIQIYDHDVIINHIVAYRLGKTAQLGAKVLMSNVLGL